MAEKRRTEAEIRARQDRNRNKAFSNPFAQAAWADAEGQWLKTRTRMPGRKKRPERSERAYKGDRPRYEKAKDYIINEHNKWVASPEGQEQRRRERMHSM